MNTKTILATILAAGCLLGAPALADDSSADNSAQPSQADGARRGPHRHHGPKLTDAQRTCLEGILGKPGEGQRPSREQMHSAFQSCGIQHPAGGPPPGPPPEERSDNE